MKHSIEVRGAEKCYGSGKHKQIILDGLNMRVRAGSIYSLIGASGCGKTTLLSCILGTKQLDSGTIRVLGHEVKKGRPLEVGHLIGYMPQSTALIPELTIREILYFFGNIFQMNQDLLKERYKLVYELLELPSENLKIKNCSGGQQRRVSIAASIIHNPWILILDEPTVGLDSLLREKIWRFLVKATNSSKLSVVITTHYISEAEYSHRCGLMRDGTLLSEASPKRIMQGCGAKTLDEAFLQLCLLKRDMVVQSLDDFTGHFSDAEEFAEEDAGTVPSFAKRRRFCKQTIWALLLKELIRIRRQPTEILAILLIPIIQMLIFAYGVGRNPAGLKIGVVNNELLDHSACAEYLMQPISYLGEDNSCIYNQKSSCFLLEEIRDSELSIIHYQSYDDAYKDALTGNASGIVVVTQNFTKELLLRYNLKMLIDSIALMEDMPEELIDLISVHLDHSNFQIALFVRYQILSAYMRFNERLTVECQQNKRFNENPLHFEEPFFGSLENDFRSSMFAPLIIQSLLFPAFGFTCFGIAQSRIDGVWNRTVLSGVRPVEILLVQIILSVTIVGLMFIETIITSILTIDITMNGNYGLLISFFILLCFTGSIMGIALSATSENIKFISIILFGTVNFLFILSGAFWPLEGQPEFLRYISYILPVSLPSISVRHIMLKGYGITHPTVYIGFLILLIWATISLLATVLVMRIRKFSEH